MGAGGWRRLLENKEGKDVQRLTFYIFCTSPRTRRPSGHLGVVRLLQTKKTNREVTRAKRSSSLLPAGAERVRPGPRGRRAADRAPATLRERPGGGVRAPRPCRGPARPEARSRFAELDWAQG